MSVELLDPKVLKDDKDQPVTEEFKEYLGSRDKEENPGFPDRLDHPVLKLHLIRSIKCLTKT